MKGRNNLKRYGSIVLSLTLLFSMLSPNAALADQGENSRKEQNLYDTEREVEQATTFPVQAIHKTGEDRKSVGRERVC